MFYLVKREDASHSLDRHPNSINDSVTMLRAPFNCHFPTLIFQFVHILHVNVSNVLFESHMISAPSTFSWHDRCGVGARYNHTMYNLFVSSVFVDTV